MNPVCPACGVAVVPGYVRCPKCHAGITGRTKRSTVEPGGTTVEPKGFPLSAIAIAVGVMVVVFGVGFALRGRGRTAGQEIAAQPQVLEAVPASPPARRVASPAAPAPAAPEVVTAAPDPAAAASDLEASLRKQRLWNRVEIIGSRLDVRSGSCLDPAMRAAIEGKKAVLRSAGLTRLRCVEQSGAVVFESEL